MNTEPKDIEELLEAVSNSSIDDTSKVLIGRYLRDREALAPEYRQKAAAKIKEVFSKYPELASTEGNELGVGIDELVQVYKEHKEMLQSLDLAIETTKNHKPKYPLLEKVKVEGLETEDTILFHGQELVKSDYEALQGLAQKYGNTDAKDYFTNEKVIALIDENARVTALRMSHLNLMEIPEQINKLTQLRALRLVNNKIKYIKNLEQLTRLKTLDLSNNQISRIENLDSLTQLHNLWLSNNKISRIENLEQATQLRNLCLNKNEISKIENLERLTQLDNLWLDYNMISRIENLEQQRVLYLLDLSNNKISRIENLEELTRLCKLKLSYNTISQINNLESLRLIWVNLSYNQISLIDHAEKLAHVNLVILHGNPIKADNPELTKLRKMKIEVII